MGILPFLCPSFSSCTHDLAYLRRTSLLTSRIQTFLPPSLGSSLSPTEAILTLHSSPPQHTTVPKDALKADWFSSSGKTPADYKILCRTDGRCADVDEPSAYDECAIARNASRAIVAPKGMGDALKSDIQAAFSSPNASFLNTVRETVFRSDPSDTYELGAVTGDFSDYFSEGAIAAFKGFEVLESSARFDAEGGSSGGGLSSGAVAGVAIACIIGGAAIGGGVFMYRRCVSSVHCTT